MVRRAPAEVRRSLLLTGAGLAVLGCLDPFEPPFDTYRFDPPSVYSMLWRQVEDCSGLRGDFARIEWYVVPGAFIRRPDGHINGAWQPPHTIYLSEYAAHDSPSGYFTVRHEMLHDLLQGGGDHPPVFATCGLLRT